MSDEHYGPYEVVYKTVDDCRITVDIYIPNGAASRSKVPTIIMIHGGGFMLGHARMNSMLQIQDCLNRGWIVAAPNHRLCPAVNMLEGPIGDCQDLLVWIREGHLDAELAKGSGEIGSKGVLSVDQENVFAMGTSAGGNLAYSLAYQRSSARAPRAILDFYGAKSFTDSFWKQPLEFIAAPPCSEKMKDSLYAERPTATKGGQSLEGQAADGTPSVADKSRLAFMLNAIKDGKVLDVIYPESIGNPSAFSAVDPTLNIRPGFPPVCIVHGDVDNMVPAHLSQLTIAELQKHGVPHKFISVPKEGHTFAGKMKLGSTTWNVQRLGFDWLEEQIA